MKKTNQIIIDFFCIQPLQFEFEDYISLTNKKYTKKLINYFKKEENTKPGFLQFITHYYFDEFLFLPIHILDNNNLTNLLKISVIDKMNKYYNTDFHLEQQTSQAWLIYNEIFKSFVLIYHIKFFINQTAFENIIKSKQNFYIFLRNMFVKDVKIVNNVNLSDYVEHIENKIKKIIIDTTGFTPFIKENTGNITFFYNINNNQKFFIKSIKEINQQAEKNQIIFNYIDLDDISFLFNGRFHSIISSQKVIDYDKSISRFFTINFHMQFMWFYQTFYLKLCNYIYKTNFTSFSNKNLNNTIFIENLVFVIETLKLKNEEFKFSIEIDKKLIYKKIESGWNIENLTIELSNYIQIFKEYINQKNE